MIAGKEKRRAVIYARLSVGTEHDVSIERQIDQCEEEIRRRGWEFDRTTDVYADGLGHHSGRTEKYRPEWRRLRERLALDGSIVAVVVSDVSRASRNSRDLLNFIAELQSRNIEFIPIHEPHLSTTSAIGKLLTQIQAAVNEYMPNRLSETQKKNIAFWKAEGGVWGKAPQGLVFSGRGKDRHFEIGQHGFWVVNGHAVIGSKDAPPFPASLLSNPAASPKWRGCLDMIREWFTLYTSRHDIGIQRGAQILNSAGWYWRNQQGLARRIRMHDLKRTVENVRLYRGFIDDKLLDRVEAVRAARKTTRTTTRKKHPPQLLSYVIRCDVCGGLFKTAYNKPSDGDFHPQYAHVRGDCTSEGAIACRKLDGQFWQLFAPVLKLTEEKKRTIAQKASEIEIRPSTVDSERASLKARLNRLNRLFLDEMMDEKEYIAERAPILQRLKALDKVQEPEANSALTFDEAMKLLSDLSGFLQDLAPLDLETANHVMRSIFKAIYVRKVYKPYNPHYLKYYTGKYLRQKTNRHPNAQPYDWQIVRVVPLERARPLLEDLHLTDIIETDSSEGALEIAPSMANAQTLNRIFQALRRWVDDPASMDQTTANEYKQILKHNSPGVFYELFPDDLDLEKILIEWRENPDQLGFQYPTIVSQLDPSWHKRRINAEIAQHFKYSLRRKNPRLYFEIFSDEQPK